MVRQENQCVGCSDLGLPCMGECCPNLNVPVLFCDNKRCIGHFTGVDRLFVVGEEQFCMDCVQDRADQSGADPWDLIEGEV